MNLFEWSIETSKLEELQKTRRAIEEQNWLLKEQRRENMLKDQRIRKLEEELRLLRGGR